MGGTRAAQPCAYMHAEPLRARLALCAVLAATPAQARRFALTSALRRSVPKRRLWDYFWFGCLFECLLASRILNVPWFPHHCRGPPRRPGGGPSLGNIFHLEVLELHVVFFV